MDEYRIPLSEMTDEQLSQELKAAFRFDDGGGLDLINEVTKRMNKKALANESTKA